MRIINLEKNVGNFQMKIEDLTIQNGKINGIIGGNGSGKTTLCKMIMGIIEKDKGQIDYGDLDMQSITMTAQRPYFTQNSVYDNICYPLKLRGIKPNEKEIDEWLIECDLLDKKHQYARSLSSGEQQKVSMIRALIFKPKLVMIDETLSNLDPENLEFFERKILKIQEKEPITWILISHRLAHIYKMCDVLHFMHKGQVLQSGNAKEVLFGSKDKRIRDFVANEVIHVEETNGIIEG